VVAFIWFRKMPRIGGEIDAEVVDSRTPKPHFLNAETQSTEASGIPRAGCRRPKSVSYCGGA